MATNIAQDEQKTWKMLVDMQQQMNSFQTGLMRALESATVAATAARGAADAAQGSGRPSRLSEPASVPNVRFGQSTTRIHPIKELYDEALKHFEKQAVRWTQEEIDRLTSLISAMEQNKYNELKIHLPTWYISVQGAFGCCGVERVLAGVTGERLCFIIHDSERHEHKKRDEHQPSREQHLHPKSDTPQAQTAHLPSVKALSSKQVFVQSCASLKFKQQEWPDLGLEDVDRQGVGPKAAEHHALEIYRKMIGKVRQKAAHEEKKKDDDQKKKEEVSKKLEDENPGNLLV